MSEDPSFPRLSIAAWIIHLLLLCFLVAGLPAVAAASPQETPKVEDPPPVNPIEQNRARALNPEIDVPGRNAALADLAKAGDTVWLRARVAEEKWDDKAPFSLFRGLLHLTRAADDEGTRNTCLVMLQAMLADGKTHADLLSRLDAVCRTVTEPNLLGGAVTLLGDARDLRGVPPLLVVIETGTADLKPLAARSLNSLTCQGFGLDAAAWKTWWEKNSSRSYAEILEEAIRRRDGTINSLRDDNLELVKGYVGCNPKAAFDYLASDDVRVKRYVAKFMLDAATNPEISGRLGSIIDHLGKGETDRQTLESLLSLLGQAANGTPGVVATLIRYLSGSDEDAAIAAESLNALHRKKALKKEDYAAIAGAAQGRLQGMKAPGQAVTLKKTLLGLLKECGSAEAALDVQLLQGFAAATHEASIRTAAIQALGVSSDAGVLGYLRNVLVTDDDGDVRFEAAFALKLLGETGKVDAAAVVAALAEGLKDLKRNVRSRCILGLGTFLKPEVVGIILEHVKAEADHGVCKDCLYTLGGFKSDAGLQAVLTAHSLLDGRGMVNDLIVMSTKEALTRICEDVPDRFFTAGKAFYDTGSFSMAAWCADRFREKSPHGNGHEEKNIEARAMQVRSLYHAGDLGRALGMLQNFEKNNGPEIPRRERLQLLAEGHLQTRNFKAAADWHDAYLGVIPEAEAVLRKQVQASAWIAHFNAKQFDRALPLAETLKNLEPANNRYLYDYARSLRMVNRRPDAEKEFQRLLAGRLGADEAAIEWQVRCDLSAMILARNQPVEAQKVIGAPGAPLPENLDVELGKRVAGRRARIQEAVDKAAAAKKPPEPTPAQPEKASDDPEKTTGKPDKKKDGATPKPAPDDEKKPAADPKKPEGGGTAPKPAGGGGTDQA